MARWLVVKDPILAGELRVAMADLAIGLPAQVHAAAVSEQFPRVVSPREPMRRWSPIFRSDLFNSSHNFRIEGLSMREFPSDIAFTPAVKAIQKQKRSRESYARMERGKGWHATINSELEEFLEALDMFYLGTANAEGQPYIQYRGGLPGFLKVIDEHTVGFADSAATVSTYAGEPVRKP